MPNLWLNKKSFIGLRVVCNHRYSIPDILWAILLKECDASCILATKHWLNCKFKFFFTSRWNGEFLWSITIHKICFYVKNNWSFRVWIFNNNLFFHKVLGLAFNLNMLFSKRLFSVAKNLILKVVKSQRVSQRELSLCFMSPSGLEGDREVTDTVPLYRERGCILRWNNKVVSIFGRVGLPKNFNIPISFSIIDNW